MLRNAVYGLAVAKAMGIAEPTLGVLNLDAAPQVMRALSRMAEKGYALRFGQSVRKDGGALLRGLDQLVSRETGMPVHVAENPLDCVVTGTGKCLDLGMVSDFRSNRHQ